RLAGAGAPGPAAHWQPGVADRPSSPGGFSVMVVSGQDRPVMKILVIDDHVLIRQAMQGVLKKLKRDALVLNAPASTKPIAITASRPDVGLILLALTLRDRGGFSVLSELRERYPAASVVVLSAVQDPGNVMKALELGARGYIPKSAQSDVILNALRLVISGGTYVPPEILARTEVAAPRPPTINRP